MDNIPSCTLTDSKKPCFQSYCANLKDKIVSWAVCQRPSLAQGDLPATRLWVGQILHIYSLGTQSDGACHVVSSLFLTRREANYCCKPYSDLTVVLLHSPLLPWSKCQSSEVTLWRHQMLVYWELKCFRRQSWSARNWKDVNIPITFIFVVTKIRSKRRRL